MSDELKSTPGERYLSVAWQRANGRRKSRSTLFPPPPRELTKVEREELASIIDSAIAAERARCAQIARTWKCDQLLDNEGNMGDLADAIEECADGK